MSTKRRRLLTRLLIVLAAVVCLAAACPPPPPPTTTTTTRPRPTTTTTTTTSTSTTTTTSTSTTTTTTTTVPTTTTTVPTPPGGEPPTPADYGFPACTGAGRNVVRPFASGTTLSSKWSVSAPPANTTYDLTGVRSTAQPSSSYPFAFGTGNDGASAGARTCLLGGELLDRFGDPPGIDWRTAHDTYNASCVKGVGTDWYQIIGTECRGIQDGFRPQESGVNVNNTRFVISDTYIANVMDDCLENDYITAGVVLDSLWDGCHTGLSERPSSDRCWVTPPGERLYVDHLLLRLRPYELDEGFGYGRLFKFVNNCVESGGPLTHNQLVIRCSTFLVPDERLDGGADGMEVPPGTVVDDSGCPGDPSTIVWLGGGPYPGDLRGLPIRVSSDIGYWNAKAAEWRARHPGLG